MRLKGLKINTELNGLCGIVAPPELESTVPGTLKVRLESEREVAVRPPNLDMLEGKNDLTAQQKEKLQKVVKQLQAEAAGGVQARRAAAAAAVAAAAEAAAKGHK